MRHGLRAIVLLTMALTVTHGIGAQTADTNTGIASFTSLAVLKNHHPQWASSENSIGLLPPNRMLESMTVVLAQSPQQELAFQQFLADQQNPHSHGYHRWLNPAEIGLRFGPSEADQASVIGWLESQGLHVNWVSPSRIFIGFGGSAADLGRAFHTDLQTYKLKGTERISISSDPLLPSNLLPRIKAIRGLYTIDEKPLHSAGTARREAPELTSNNGDHFVAPADFATIYDLPSGASGVGQTIGIVGRSRTDSADFDNFRQKTGTTFADPTEIVPTAFGGVDPGPALTAPPSSDVSTGNQLEATLDVTRAASIANAAKVLLVIATSASGGIDADAQYLVQTTPLPAQIMNVSFGACESSAGSSGVTYWDTLFQQAAAEGISVFVASGDSGASECDEYFATPPATPQPNSPNYICSSSYVTCVGGTEFNDTSNPSDYWSASNQSNRGSALQYIPEGGWNEPFDFNGNPQAAASGGGVSSIISTPSWQIGTGVPKAKAGRYMPDLAFTASAHDGYFACFAAGGGSCVAASNGSYQFEYFFGTSGAAPDMAGITALLDEKLGSAQGNLNPGLYQLAVASPATFHDVTVASSGVGTCDINTPSMCNNSIPGPTGLTGGQAGYPVTAGYDEVTGLGSLDVQSFYDNYAPVTGTATASFTVAGSAATVTAGGTTGNTSTVTVTPVSGFTGTVTLTAAITSAPANAVQSPTLSFGSTGSVSITGTTNGTATLTITTTAPGGCPQTVQTRPAAPANRGSWYAGGGTLLACMFFGIPASRRRQRWQRFMALVLFLGTVSGGVTACGGSGGSKSTCNVITAGTTPGAYTITVTGMSGNLTKTGTISFTVQ